jgi:hypothetical protein
VLIASLHNPQVVVDMTCYPDAGYSSLTIEDLKKTVYPSAILKNGQVCLLIEYQRLIRGGFRSIFNTAVYSGQPRTKDLPVVICGN